MKFTKTWQFDFFFCVCDFFLRVCATQVDQSHPLTKHYSPCLPQILHSNNFAPHLILLRLFSSILITLNEQGTNLTYYHYYLQVIVVTVHILSATAPKRESHLIVLFLFQKKKKKRKRKVTKASSQRGRARGKMFMFILLGIIESVLILSIYELIDILICIYRKTKYKIDENAVILVAHGSKGLGKQLCLHFARNHKCKIVILDSCVQASGEVVQDINKLGAKGFFF